MNKVREWVPESFSLEERLNYLFEFNIILDNEKLQLYENLVGIDIEAWNNPDFRTSLLAASDYEIFKAVVQDSKTYLNKIPTIIRWGECYHDTARDFSIAKEVYNASFGYENPIDVIQSINVRENNPEEILSYNNLLEPEFDYDNNFSMDYNYDNEVIEERAESNLYQEYNDNFDAGFDFDNEPEYFSGNNSTVVLEASQANNVVALNSVLNNDFDNWNSLLFQKYNFRNFNPTKFRTNFLNSKKRPNNKRWKTFIENMLAKNILSITNNSPPTYKYNIANKNNEYLGFDLIMEKIANFAKNKIDFTCSMFRDNLTSRFRPDTCIISEYLTSLLNDGYIMISKVKSNTIYYKLIN